MARPVKAQASTRASNRPTRPGPTDHIGFRQSLVASQPSTDGSNRATPPDSTHQFRLGPPLVLWQA
ncbi:hypothetical protein CYV19_08925 [Natronobacterium gregoryi SP2]|uniref:Uncharacterized protein n=1 Tax=Natronobacterium gregoryi (strain ATCC 43098 / DSM 3393 / CCM 3738 / CIP 104747 / IAM 13177 / JCM 8860 / NBRC 102187 / NCIMB 2189 / SP2) TaxID=797304 RepID=A0A2J4JF84_NATGS|nr:hypothetical protein CYV19_08925 [Natronobacterium gregoryi SP2]